MAQAEQGMLPAAPARRSGGTRRRITRGARDTLGRSWIAVGLLALGVIGSALLLGGAWPEVALFAAVCAWAAWSCFAFGSKVEPCAWIFLGLGAYCALQVVPLPIGLLEQLSPHAALVWERAAPNYSVRWASLSVDPGATSVEVFKWCGYGATVAAAALLARRQSVLPGIALVFLSALLTALVWALHAAVGLDALYGLYHPRFFNGDSVAPLLNRNNLAGYLSLGFFCGLGLMSSGRLERQRPLIAIGVAFLIGAVLLTRSTGGSAACLAGMVVLIALTWSRRRSRGRLAAMFGTTFAGLLLAALLGPSGNWIQLAKYSQKFMLVKWSLALVRDHFWFGTGRGAFETVFPPYRQGTLGDTPNQIVFSHPENFVVQWLAEWGVVVSVVAAALIGFRVVRKLRRGGLTLAGMCALVGIGVVVLQNLVDLGLELPATGLAVALTLGTVLGGSRQQVPVPASPRGSAGFLALAALSTVTAVVGLSRYGLHLVWQERDSDYAKLQELDGTLDENQDFFATLVEQMKRRPGEPYFPLVAAQASQRLDADAMPWIARALERDPTRGDSYLVLALELARRGAHVQALEAIRRGIVADPTRLQHAARLARAFSSDKDELARAAPEGELGTRYFLAVASDSTEYQLRWDMVELAAERDPNGKQAIASKGYLVSEALRDQRERCSDERVQACEQELEAIVRALQRMDPQSADALRLQAQLLTYREHIAEAVTLLLDRCTSSAEPVRCLQEGVDLTEEAQQKDQLERVLERYLPAACVSSRDCFRAETKAGRALMMAGAPLKAYDHYKRAADMEPNAETWRRAARAARAAGITVLAKGAERKSARLGAPLPSARVAP